MADRSPYIRSTPMGAYDEGAYFLAWLDYDFSLKGLSFKSFLAHYFDKYKYQAVSTEVFKSEIEAYSQKNYTREFNYYIYGNNNKNLSTTHSSNPYHPKLSQAELLELL